MKFHLLIFLSLLAFTQTVSANCSKQITYKDSLVIREDFLINPSQSASFQHTFNDDTCINSDTIKHATKDNSEVVVGLYDDTVKLKLTFTWDNPGDISLSGGKREFSGAYNIVVSPADSATKVDISAGSGNSVEIQDMALMTSANSYTLGAALVNFGVCLFTTNKGWTQCIKEFREWISRGAGTYSADLNVVFNRKLTTCEPKDLTLDLPSVSVNQLTMRGEVREPAVSGDIVLDCKNSVSTPGKTTRDITVYLESDLLPEGGDNTYLTPLPGGGSGVGFQLKNSNGEVIKINRTGFANDSLKKFTKGEVIKNEERISVTARYFVIDPDNVKAGKITSNAIIKVIYP